MINFRFFQGPESRFSRFFRVPLGSHQSPGSLFSSMPFCLGRMSTGMLQLHQQKSVNQTFLICFCFFFCLFVLFFYACLVKVVSLTELILKFMQEMLQYSYPCNLLFLHFAQKMISQMYFFQLFALIMSAEILFTLKMYRLMFV